MSRLFLSFNAVVVVATSVLLASCSSAQVLQALVPRATEDDRARAAELIAGVCEEEAGEFVYDTASNVEGFLLLPNATYGNGRDQPATEIRSAGCGAHCLRYFVSGYAYLEANVTAYPRPSGIGDDFEVGTGRHRYELELRKGENCKVYDRIRRHNQLIQQLERENPDLLGGKCLVARRVGNFQSRYGYQHSFLEPAFKLADDLVGNKRGSRVIDLTTGRDMAVNVGISAHKPGVQSHHIASCGAAFTVKITKVLQPIQPSGGERQ